MVIKYMEIYEDDHFYKAYEDRRNDLYILTLNDDVATWIYENMGNKYDINCDDYVNDRSQRCDFIIIEFETEEDAMAFKLRWL